MLLKLILTACTVQLTLLFVNKCHLQSWLMGSVTGGWWLSESLPGPGTAPCQGPVSAVLLGRTLLSPGAARAEPHRTCPFLRIQKSLIESVALTAHS